VRKKTKTNDKEQTISEAKVRACVLSRAAAGTLYGETRERLLAELLEVSDWLLHNNLDLNEIEFNRLFDIEYERLDDVGLEIYERSRTTAKDNAAYALFKAIIAERESKLTAEDRKVLDEDILGSLKMTRKKSTEDLKEQIAIADTLDGREAIETR